MRPSGVAYRASLLRAVSRRVASSLASAPILTMASTRASGSLPARGASKLLSTAACAAQDNSRQARSRSFFKVVSSGDTGLLQRPVTPTGAQLHGLQLLLTLVTRNVRAPWIRAHRARRLPHH